MLALCEPINMMGFSDRPHLGCAMLIAACQAKGIKTTLIKAQTRYLRDMFVNDSEEIWKLIQELPEDSIKELNIADYRNSILENGMNQFQDELSSLYHYIIIDKNARHYFNGRALAEFSKFYNLIVNLYFHYITRLNHTNLLIINHYIDEVIKRKPCYVGFSLHDSFDHYSRAIRKRIKELTGLPIIVGGSCTPFIDLKNLEKYFSEEYFDYLVIGTAEHALPSLIEALENNKEPEGISNVFYRKNGQIRCNDLKGIRNLDSLPYPDYTQFDLDLYLTPNRILPLQTSRGCSWKKCAFCSHYNIYIENYANFGVERVVDIMQYLHSLHDCSHFVFHDDELLPGRAKKIGEVMLNHKFKNTYIYTYGRMTNGYNNNELLSLLRNAGFVTIAWGMESGCQRILGLMNKGTNLTTMSQILKKSSKNNISNLCFIMFGFPGETTEEAEQTVEFLKKHADYIKEVLHDYFHLISYSPVGRNPEKWGVDIKENGGYSMKSGMSPEDAKAFYHKFCKELQMNRIKISTGEVKYLWDSGLNLRMLHFQVASHELLPFKTLSTLLKNKKLSNIFPIILGKIEKQNGDTVWCPINVKETYFINNIVPEKYRILNELDEKLIALSDGALSIEDIISTAYKDYKGTDRKKSIQEKCINFFLDIFSKNYALAFAKPWRS